MGNLIPAGTGCDLYRYVKIKDLSTDSVPVESHEADEDFLDLGA